MKIMFSTVIWQFALLYLEDIVIFLRTPKHIASTNMVLTLFTMCVLPTNLIDYLGDVIKHGQLKVDDHTARDTHKVKVPTAVNERRSFSGICNIFRLFVADFERFVSFLFSRPKLSKRRLLHPLTM